MGGNDDAFAGLYRGRNFFVPEREKALDGIFKAFGEGKLRFGNASVTWIVSGPTLIGFIERRGRDVVTAAPN